MRKIIITIFLSFLALQLANFIIPAAPVKAASETIDLSQLKVNLGSAGDKTLAERLATDPSITDFWKMILKLTNIAVVLLLIVISLATIFHLNIDVYGVKKALPSLLIGIVMANFSFLIVRQGVDFADVIDKNIILSQLTAKVNIDGKEINTCPEAGNITAETDPQALRSKASNCFANQLSSAIFKGGFNALAKNASTGTVAAGTVGAVIGVVGIMSFLSLAALPAIGAAFLFAAIIFFILASIPAILILILAFLFVIRNYIIMLLAVLSPVAFICIAWQPVQGFFKQWWTQYARWVFMAPISLFLLWLAITFSQLTMANGNPNIASYAIVILMIWLAIQAPFKLGGSVMATWASVGKTLGKKGGNLWGLTGGAAWHSLDIKRLAAEKAGKTGTARRLGKLQTAVSWSNIPYNIKAVQAARETLAKKYEKGAMKGAGFTKLAGREHFRQVQMEILKDAEEGKPIDVQNFEAVELLKSVLGHQDFRDYAEMMKRKADAVITSGEGDKTSDGDVIKALKETDEKGNLKNKKLLEYYKNKLGLTADEEITEDHVGRIRKIDQTRITREVVGQIDKGGPGFDKLEVVLGEALKEALAEKNVDKAMALARLRIGNYLMNEKRSTSRKDTREYTEKELGHNIFAYTEADQPPAGTPASATASPSASADNRAEIERLKQERIDAWKNADKPKQEALSEQIAALENQEPAPAVAPTEGEAAVAVNPPEQAEEKYLGDVHSGLVEAVSQGIANGMAQLNLGGMQINVGKAVINAQGAALANGLPLLDHAGLKKQMWNMRMLRALRNISSTIGKAGGASEAVADQAANYIDVAISQNLAEGKTPPKAQEIIQQIISNPKISDDVKKVFQQPGTEIHQAVESYVNNTIVYRELKKGFAEPAFRELQPALQKLGPGATIAEPSFNQPVGGPPAGGAAGPTETQPPAPAASAPVPPTTGGEEIESAKIGGPNET